MTWLNCPSLSFTDSLLGLTSLPLSLPSSASWAAFGARTARADRNSDALHLASLARWLVRSSSPRLVVFLTYLPTVEWSCSRYLLALMRKPACLSACLLFDTSRQIGIHHFIDERTGAPF